MDPIRNGFPTEKYPSPRRTRVGYVHNGFMCVTLPIIEVDLIFSHSNNLPWHQRNNLYYTVCLTMSVS